MSLKAIDMQIAAHKNTDLGQLQSQMQQKAVSDQAALAAAGMRAAENERRKSAKVDESPKSMIRGRDAGKGGAAQAGRKSKASKTASTDPDKGNRSGEFGHPYKGHHIDLSL